MKRIILFIGLVAAFALLAGSTSAQADPTGNESCGGFANLAQAGYWWDPAGVIGSWVVNENHTCGDQKTFTWEIQHTTDGGLHWSDWTGEQGVRSNSCNSGCGPFQHTQTNYGCAVTGSYRLKFWGSDWANQMTPTGAGIACAGTHIHPA